MSPKRVVVSPVQRIPAIYLRVSTEDQAESGYGLDVQRARCLAMATVKGWDTPPIYADEGISGTKDASGRPALARLLTDVDAGRISAVIVLSLDRLGRRTKIVLDLAERFATANVALVSCKESLDTTSPTGQFVLTMFAALAQLERDTIVERTGAGREARGMIDGERGGRLPYGYRRSEDRVVVDADTADVVRLIDQLHRKKRTLKAIAETLTAMQQPTPQGGKAWYPATVRCILQNTPMYRGGLRGPSQQAWPTIL